MNKNNLEETKKSNKQSEINGGSNNFSNDVTSIEKEQLNNEQAANDISNSASNFDMSSITGMDSSSNDANSKEKEQATNDVSNSASNFDMSSITGMDSSANDVTSKAKGQYNNDISSMSDKTSSINDVTLEETKKINARSAANKDAAKK